MLVSCHFASTRLCFRFFYNLRFDLFDADRFYIKVNLVQVGEVYQLTELESPSSTLSLNCMASRTIGRRFVTGPFLIVYS